MRRPKIYVGVVYFLFFVMVGALCSSLVSDIDYRAQPIVLQFLRYAEIYGCQTSAEGLTVELVNLEATDPEAAGLCELGFGMRQIYLDKVYWGAISEEEKQALVYHELGHCLLGRDHNDNEFKLTRRAKSLMNSVVTSSWQYDLDYYLEELFSGC